jgi:hypothetical protein
MKTSTRIALIAILAILAVPFTPAGRAAGSGSGMPPYDRTTEVTLWGTIVEVGTVTEGTDFPFSKVFIFAGSDEVEVRLGPLAAVKAANFGLSEGFTIAVTGSRVQINGKSVVIAREIRRANRTLRFRDANGNPLWNEKGFIPKGVAEPGEPES